MDESNKRKKNKLEEKCEYLTLKERKERYINYVLVILIIIFLICSIIYINNNKYKQSNEIAYVDTSTNEKVDNTSFIRFIYDGFNHNNPPKKNKYVISSVSCDNAVGYWDNKKWELNISSIVDKVSCSLSFKKKENKTTTKKKNIVKNKQKKNSKIINEEIKQEELIINNNDNEEEIKDEILFDLDKCDNNENCNYKINMDSNKEISIKPTNNTKEEIVYELISGDDAIYYYNSDYVFSKDVVYKESYIKVSSKDDPSINTIIKIVVEAKRINTRIYNINRHNNTINNIELKTDINTFINNIMNKSYKLHVYDSYDIEIKDYTKYIGTGMKLKFIIDNKVIDELELIVTGDIDGDGMCTSTDYSLVFNHVIRQNELYGINLLASDVDNNNMVDNKDYELIYKYISNKISSFIIYF